MEKLVNSKKKLAILSSGGVLRNKKLQKGSTLPLLNSANINNKEINDYNDIHIFSVFWNRSTDKSALLGFRSKRKSPFI